MYESPSIKDIKRESRGDENTEKQFTFGHRQGMPSDFNELLQISSFKRILLRFFLKSKRILSMAPYWEKRYFIALQIMKVLHRG